MRLYERKLIGAGFLAVLAIAGGTATRAEAQKSQQQSQPPASQRPPQNPQQKPQQKPQQEPHTTWAQGGSPIVGYTMTARGYATDTVGAVLTLESNGALAGNPYGVVAASIPADSFRGRRVRVVADVDVRDAAGGGSPYVRADLTGGGFVLENGMSNPVTGTATAHREVVISVPSNATVIKFGVLLAGSGAMTARHVRLVAMPRVPPNTPLAPAARAVLDSAIAVVTRESLWRDTVTWSALLPEVRAMAAGAASPSDVYSAIGLLLTGLGDHHSFHMPPARTNEFKTGGASNPRADVRSLSDGIGYISMPGYSGTEPVAMRAFAQAAYDAMRAIANRSTCGWILDLRSNTGGNMWPMLGALHPFLSNAGLGSFVSAKGSAPLWHATDVVDIRIPGELGALEKMPVAVLTGPRTASSGEAVTISFKGRPNTRFFGEATAGLSTANEGYQLPDGSMILLTVSVEADRNGVRYGHAIEPDVKIAPVENGDDVQRAAAIDWLRQVCVVRR